MKGWGAKVMGATGVYASFDALADRAAADAVWVVGTNVTYSVFQEFGTASHAPQPYFRPAIEHAKRNAGAYLEKSPNVNAGIAAIAHAIEANAKRNAPVDTGRLRSSIRAERVR